MLAKLFSCRCFVHACLLCLSLIAGLANAAEQSADEGFFSQTWGDFHEELNNAQTQGKQGVLLFFEMEGCPFCIRMRETVFNQPEIQAYFQQHWLIFPVDIEGSVEITDFDGQSMTSKAFAQDKLRVRATPVMIFYDLQGDMIYRHTGPTKDAQEFLWLGEFVIGGYIKEMKFVEFRQQRRQAIK